MSREILKSAIYEGTIRHRRFSPKIHDFMYQVFMVYLDLDEVDYFLSLSAFWSRSIFSPARFKRSDFHGDTTLSIKEAIYQTINEQTGAKVNGPIRVLANLRYFGYNMNPLTTYYCFDETDSFVQYIVAEVNNTPWNERHAYVLPCTPKAKQDVSFEKTFHVSPFNPLDMRYRWRSNMPCESLFIHLENWQSTKIFDATLVLKRHEAKASVLNRMLIRYPVMTVKTVVAIYWQAIKIYFKKVPLQAHSHNVSKRTFIVNSEELSKPITKN